MENLSQLFLPLIFIKKISPTLFLIPIRPFFQIIFLLFRLSYSNKKFRHLKKTSSRNFLEFLRENSKKRSNKFKGGKKEEEEQQQQQEEEEEEEIYLKRELGINIVSGLKYAGFQENWPGSVPSAPRETTRFTLQTRSLRNSWRHRGEYA